MFMCLMFTSLVVYFAGVCLLSKSKNYLYFPMISMFSSFSVSINIIFLIQFHYDYFLPAIISVFPICAGVLGLCTWVPMIRSYGNGFLKFF